MARVEVLVELDVEVHQALTTFAAASRSLEEGQRQVARLLPDIRGIDYRPTVKPVPMFTLAGQPDTRGLSALAAFASPEPSDDLPSVTQVVPAQVDEQALLRLQQQPGVQVWPSSPVDFYEVDCPQFRAAVSVDEIRARLGVEAVWETGARGGGVVVGLLDEGINGDQYPVAGGFARPEALQPGEAAIGSHGSMCAADVLVAAPEAKLYDYPFLVQRSGGALVMLNALLEHRRLDGTPHLVSNSWGFYRIPSQEEDPHHEVWDLQHPLHRKVREVIISGATVLFAAGNCGEPCPARNCHQSSIGASRSIHGSNSLEEVITVAAVNSEGERIGYSSQGPGMFEKEKPDVAAYSHFFGNFGPGRPGGDGDQPFDNGTSAACPVAAGIVALLLSARPGLSPGELKAALIEAADGSGTWSADFGHGIVNAKASFDRLGGGAAGS
jgi:subtilisin family serine protease